MPAEVDLLGATEALTALFRDEPNGDFTISWTRGSDEALPLLSRCQYATGHDLAFFATPTVTLYGGAEAARWSAIQQLAPSALALCALNLDRLDHSDWATTGRASVVQEVVTAVGLLAAAERADTETRAFLLHLAASRMPFLDLLESGIGFLWAGSGAVVAMSRPGLVVQAGALHCETGPAVHWADGSGHWYWRGREVSRRVVESPRSLDPVADVLPAQAEVRRIMVERVGYARIVAAVGDRIASDDTGILWNVELEDDEALRVVEVLNSTHEPDGTFARYYLRVPPEVETAREAVAWSFGLEESEYQPSQES